MLSDPENFSALPGVGVQAWADGRLVSIGNRAMLAERGVLVGAEADMRAAELEQAGHGVLPVALGNELAGLMVVEDTLRAEAKAAVRSLNRMGVRTVLISGDNRRTAARVGMELGIAEVHAEVLPQDKVEIVRRLQSAGRKVAFVGDGVNDGPALAAADVGVAMGLAGTDVAVETAEIALLADDLSRLPHLLSLSRRAVRAIRQNLLFSLAVLAGAVGLTIPGILTPVTGALLHELSSIPVIMNSARLISIREQSAVDVA